MHAAGGKQRAQATRNWCFAHVIVRLSCPGYLSEQREAPVKQYNHIAFRLILY
jgi:hypothetical protein